MYSVGDVTIIIPVYCRTQEELGWFGECLESAQEQDCPIVVVSDGSPKPVGVIPTGVVYYELPENRGPSFARNVATDLVSTPLILPLDCDDTLRSDAVKSLVEAYDGTPLYPDLSKFGTEDTPHYQLLEFSCEHLYTKVGLASVNVLHKKEQWKAVGGWNEFIHFYEDGEYNARLMLSYCGRRYPEPLVNYRIHPSQRTNTNKGIAGTQTKKILEIIRGYSSMCCGNKARRMQRALPQQVSNVRRAKMDSSDLPGTQGERVLALYVGGRGPGKHYYRGPVTGWPYKVQKNEMYYVDPRDTKFEGDPVSKSLFIRVLRDTGKPAPQKEEVVRAPRKVEVEKTPVVEKAPVEEKAPETPETPKKPVMFKPKEELPDITNLRWQKEIRHMDFTPEQARKLIDIEKTGKGRVKVIEHLEKFLK